SLLFASMTHGSPHELSPVAPGFGCYSDWLTQVFEAYHVPLVDKQGEEPKSYDYFEETSLTMCQLRRIDGVWWLGTGEGRRRDGDEALAENVGNVEVNNEDAPAENVEVNQEAYFDSEAVINETKIQGEEMEKEAEFEESGSREKYFDAIDEDRPDEVDAQVPDVATSAPSSVQ
ncbi:hypothetical protein Dimus_000543, partial [Dionaea muscipula]